MKYSHKKGTCELCGRTASLHKHHLRPKARKPKKNLSRKSVAWFCEDCSAQVHTLFSRKELTRRYFTVDLLKENMAVQKYIDWVRRKKIVGLHPAMRR